MARIKICGITNIDDYNDAISFGADYTGFIFYKKSPRYIPFEQATKIIRFGRQEYNRKVGVFVNEKPEVIKRIFYSAGLDIVQLHGQEDPDYCFKLELPFWKVIHIKDSHSIELIKEYDCKTFLLDTFSKSRMGGTGNSFDLKIAEKAILTGKNIVIAGGVSVNNIESILNLNPFAIDINSSVEVKPGKKDKEKLKQIFEKLKNYRV